MTKILQAKKRGSKSVVRREVVRLVTAGTLTEEGLLEARVNNYLAAFGQTRNEESPALAWVIYRQVAHIFAGTFDAIQGRLAGDAARITSTGQFATRETASFD